MKLLLGAIGVLFGITIIVLIAWGSIWVGIMVWALILNTIRQAVDTLREEQEKFREWRDQIKIERDRLKLENDQLKANKKQK